MKNVVLELCAGTACHVLGANSLSTFLQALSPEQKSNLRVCFTHCLGGCGQGPNVKVNGKIYNRVTPDKLREIINQHCEQE